MRVSGIMIIGMAEVMKDIPMEMFILENFNMVKLMARDVTNGQKVPKCMMENGQEVSDMVMVYGKN